MARRSTLFALAWLPLVILQWPRPAVAFHVHGFSITVMSINSVTRQVDVKLSETTGSPFGPHTAGNVNWGDAVASSHMWTSSVTGPPNTYKVSASHTYPDLTTRTISATSDCCNTSGFSPRMATAQIDFGCSDAPMGGCLAPTSAQLQIKNNTTDDSKDQVQFKWLKGTSPGGSSTAQYFFCIYAPTLVLQAIVPSGPNFTLNPAGILQYKDNTGAAGGITNIKVKPSAVGKGQVQVKGKGMNLDDPAMPLTQPVTAQLQNSEGQCWGHQFSSPEKKNTLEQFKDKEP